MRPGEMQTVECLAKPRRRSLLGGEEISPFTASVESAGESVQTHMGEATTRALLQPWMLAPLIIGALAILAVWFVLGS